MIKSSTECSNYVIRVWTPNLRLFIVSLTIFACYALFGKLYYIQYRCISAFESEHLVFLQEGTEWNDVLILQNTDLMQ